MNKNYRRWFYRCGEWKNEEMSCSFFEQKDKTNNILMNNDLVEGRKEDREVEKKENEKIVELKKQVENYEKELVELKYICYILIVLIIKVVFERLFW